MVGRAEIKIYFYTLGSICNILDEISDLGFSESLYRVKISSTKMNDSESESESSKISAIILLYYLFLFKELVAVQISTISRECEI